MWFYFIPACDFWASPSVALFASLSPLLGPLSVASCFFSWEQEKILWGYCRPINPDTASNHFHFIAPISRPVQDKLERFITPLGSALKARIDVLCPWTLKTSLGFLSIPHFHPTRQCTGQLPGGLDCYISLHSSAPINPENNVKLVLRVEKADSESCIL